MQEFNILEEKVAKFKVKLSNLTHEKFIVLSKQVTFCQWFQKQYCCYENITWEDKIIDLAEKINNFFETKCQLTWEENHDYQNLRKRIKYCKNPKLIKKMNQNLKLINKKYLTPLPDKLRYKFSKLFDNIFYYYKLIKKFNWLHNKLGFNTWNYILEENEIRVMKNTEKEIKKKENKLQYINRCIEYLFEKYSDDSIVTKCDFEIKYKAHFEYYKEICTHSIDFNSTFGFSDWYIDRESFKNLNGDINEYTLSDFDISDTKKIMGFNDKSITTNFDLNSEKCLCELIRPFRYPIKNWN